VFGHNCKTIHSASFDGPTAALLCLCKGREKRLLKNEKKIQKENPQPLPRAALEAFLSPMSATTKASLSHKASYRSKASHSQAE
jgi:hypothetical protein